MGNINVIIRGWGRGQSTTLKLGGISIYRAKKRSWSQKEIPCGFPFKVTTPFKIIIIIYVILIRS